jgi:hypothetical protein
MNEVTQAAFHDELEKVAGYWSAAKKYKMKPMKRLPKPPSRWTAARKFKIKSFKLSSS